MRRSQYFSLGLLLNLLSASFLPFLQAWGDEPGQPIPAKATTQVEQASLANDARRQVSWDGSLATIPVLMAVKRQQAVNIPSGFFGAQYSPDSPLSQIDVYRLVSYLVAKSDGFADYTRKKVFLVYRTPPAATGPVPPSVAPVKQDEEIAVLRCDIKTPGSRLNHHRGDCAPEKGQPAPRLGQVLSVYVKWHNGEIIAENLARLIMGTSSISAVALPLALKKD